MVRGLVVGKFMPLHKGHELLINTATKGCDELTVVVYDTPVDHPLAKLLPVEKRTQWVLDLFPQVTNVVSRRDILTDLPHEEKDKPEYAQDYADDLAFLGQFDYVFSSEHYGEPFAKALGAEHRMVDFTRRAFPISGTKVRDNTYAARSFVSDRVYRDLIQKVCFVGTESTGKSTLARALAQEFSTQYVEEYGRTFWEAKRKTNTPDAFEDFWHTGKVQHETEEEAVQHANRFVFCDTNAWTTYQWSLLYYGTADAKLRQLAFDTKDEYIWFFCGNEFGWVDDGSRELKENSRDFQIQLQAAMMRWNIFPYMLHGPVDERLKKVRSVLA
jgi:HTH-type transcriptional repressor of NAD biosynthesis genes